jgi:arylsulfatase A-like enzyme
LHYYDPHHSYAPRSPWYKEYTSEAATQKHKLFIKSSRELAKLIPMLKENPEALSNLVALYDSEINYVDDHIGKLIDSFGFDNNTLFIITSDHGEEFLEHGRLSHAHTLYQESINIPLIIKLPHSTSKREVEHFANLVDIVPTILHLLEITPPEHMLGNNLIRGRGLPVLEKIFKKQGADYTFSELDRHSILKTIITPKYKYIYNYKTNTEQLYNIKSDSLELENCAEKKPELRKELKDKLLNWVSSTQKFTTKEKLFQLPQDETEKLKGLGYIQ